MVGLEVSELPEARIIRKDHQGQPLISANLIHNQIPSGTCSDPLKQPSHSDPSWSRKPKVSLAQNQKNVLGEKNMESYLARNFKKKTEILTIPDDSRLLSYFSSDDQKKRLQEKLNK